MTISRLALGVATFFCSGALVLADGHAVGDDVIAAQRAALAAETAGKGYGPQSPRDLNTLTGNNARAFAAAPAYTEMNLCNIHFHEGAEHSGGNFTTYNGNGDGTGYNSGFAYDGTLTDAELAPVDYPVGPTGKKGALEPGDTIEVHYVHTTAQITPGPTLGACLTDQIINPQLRVETQVFVLVNDAAAADFVDLTRVDVVGGYHQAVNLPSDTGAPITYDGSTTGPDYNEKASPIQVSWSVRPEVKKVHIGSVAEWMKANIFDERKAHGVRNLVVNPDLISNIDS
ncbi:delta-class carbonic anhydrase [uncultured Tateyamaria sp.]|uniref:delta-class carbonic anhydrase n=1 Tax=uncultured Tateyamaria sp. TaxID=455651 RepID=UPI00263318ED|nr:delta-class carbonic anhydrase [uncultured Tateyamaria sp.]